MKWYNVGMLQGKEAESFKSWLKTNNIYYEASDAGAGFLHFEIQLAPEMVEKVNAALDEIWG